VGEIEVPHGFGINAKKTKKKKRIFQASIG
jgi:hypothetical protein